MREWNIDSSDRCNHRLEIVVVQTPRCPSCGGTKITRNRSVDQGDGSRMKWAYCACGHRFIEIWD